MLSNIFTQQFCNDDGSTDLRISLHLPVTILDLEQKSASGSNNFSGDNSF